MTQADVKRLGLLLAIQAEIEGMKVENMRRKEVRQKIFYGESDFFDKAEQIREIIYKHDEQL